MAIATHTLMAQPAENAVLQPGDAQLRVVRGMDFPFTGRVFPGTTVAAWSYFAAVPDYASTPTCQIYWYAAGNSGATVTWEVSFGWLGNGDATRIPELALTTVTAVAQTIGGNSVLRMQSIVVPAGLAANDWVVMRLTRDLSDASAAGTDAVCLGLALNFTGA